LGQSDTDEMDCIHLDFSFGTREAVAHLLSAGCQRIAFVGPAAEHDARVRAYMALMSEAGKITEHIKTASGLRAAGYKAMQEYLMEHKCPDGLFCFNDEIAIGCYAALKESGVRVPEDVRLVGFDGLENSRLSPCPISSVVVPIEEMSTLAWEMLRRRIEDPQAPLQHETLTPRLEIRASSRR
jgi:LacI family transcriptional regulator